MKVDGYSGADLALTHAKKQMATGFELENAERFGAMVAASTKLREYYGPTPRTAEPLEQPLPETIKGAIASAKG